LIGRLTATCCARGTKRFEKISTFRISGACPRFRAVDDDEQRTHAWRGE